MDRKLYMFFTAFLCMVLMSTMTVTAMAITGDESGSSQSSSKASSAASASSSVKTDSSSSEKQTSSSEKQTSSEKKTSSSEKSTSSEESTSSKASSTSGTTSGVKSGGTPGKKTFIKEDGTETEVVNSEDVGSEKVNETASGTEDEHIDYFEKEVSKFSSKFTKYLWIPITISVLCIAGLIYVNIAFRAKKHSGASRRNGSSVHRRKSGRR